MFWNHEKCWSESSLSVWVVHLEMLMDDVFKGVASDDPTSLQKREGQSEGIPVWHQPKGPQCLNQDSLEYIYIYIYIYKLEFLFI